MNTIRGGANAAGMQAVSEQHGQSLQTLQRDGMMARIADSIGGRAGVGGWRSRALKVGIGAGIAMSLSACSTNYGSTYVPTQSGYCNITTPQNPKINEGKAPNSNMKCPQLPYRPYSTTTITVQQAQANEHSLVRERRALLAEVGEIGGGSIIGLYSISKIYKRIKHGRD